jgi:hypothetical protein
MNVSCYKQTHALYRPVDGRFLRPYCANKRARDDDDEG